MKSMRKRRKKRKKTHEKAKKETMTQTKLRISKGYKKIINKEDTEMKS